MKRSTLLILVGLVVYGCNIKLEGRPGISKSISDSINRKVFMGKYKVIFKPTEGGDTLSINVIEAWAERKWRFTKFNYEETNIQDRYQLCMRVDKGSIAGLNNQGFIERRGKESIGKIGKDIIWFSYFKIADSVIFKVFEGPPQLEIRDRKPLGMLMLEKYCLLNGGL